MENIKDLIDQHKFIRVDAQGEHIETFDEFCKQSVEDILTALNRYPKQLIALYEKTQNKKFLNDIGLAMCFGHLADNYDLLKSIHDNLKKNYDQLHMEHKQTLQELELIKSNASDTESLEKKIANQDEAYETLRKKYKELEDEKKEALTRFDEMDAMYEDSKSQYEKLYEEYEKLNNQHKELLGKQDDANIQNEKLQEKLKDTEQALNTSKKSIESMKEEWEIEKHGYKVALEKSDKSVETLRNSEATLYKRIEEYESTIKKLEVEKELNLVIEAHDLAELANNLSRQADIISKYTGKKCYENKETEQPASQKIVKMGTNSKFNPVKNTLREGVDDNTCDNNPPVRIL